MRRQRRLLARAVDARRADRRVRGVDRGLQRHLQAAGRGRRAPDQRRRRDRHRSRRAPASARRRARGSTQRRRRAQRRAAAAPLRLRRRRPAGPLRRAARDDRRRRQAAERAGSRAARRRAADAPARPAARRRARVAPRPCTDFQLHPGDLLRLRLQDGAHEAVHDGPVPLRRRRQGVPDRADATRFLVANADYVAAHDRQRRGRRRSCVQTDGTSPHARRRSASAQSSARAPQVTDIVDQRQVVGSNLTAVELSGPHAGRARRSRSCWPSPPPDSRSASGFQRAAPHVRDRRALGARPRQLGGFVWSESAFVTGGGLVLGRRSPRRLTTMLVKVLTGVFDPPPDALVDPVGLPRLLVGLIVAAVAVAGA